jgi:hypothetical protein
MLVTKLRPTRPASMTLQAINLNYVNAYCNKFYQHWCFGVLTTTKPSTASADMPDWDLWHSRRRLLWLACREYKAADLYSYSAYPTRHTKLSIGYATLASYQLHSTCVDSVTLAWSVVVMSNIILVSKGSHMSIAFRLQQTRNASSLAHPGLLQSVFLLDYLSHVSLLLADTSSYEFDTSSSPEWLLWAVHSGYIYHFWSVLLPPFCTCAPTRSLFMQLEAGQ